MSEETNETLQAFISQMNDITNQFLEMKSSIQNIEDNICEVSVVNGGGLPVTIKTKNLLENMFEHTKPGGSIDIKLKQQADRQAEVCSVHQKTFNEAIGKCKTEHSFIRKLNVFNKTGNQIVDSLKIVGFFLLLILSGWGWVESISARKEATKDKQELTNLNHKIEQLEKIINK